mmetsp:Transcript_17238/g.42760  ORF Transcript_17238/g.42760 Transcript_17238/m.42760 type:complete len:461 (+) Transcript_17238:306-1688(+)
MLSSPSCSTCTCPRSAPPRTQPPPPPSFVSCSSSNSSSAPSLSEPSPDLRSLRSESDSATDCICSPYFSENRVRARILFWQLPEMRPAAFISTSAGMESIAPTPARHSCLKWDSAAASSSWMFSSFSRNVSARSITSSGGELSVLSLNAAFLVSVGEPRLKLCGREKSCTNPCEGVAPLSELAPVGVLAGVTLFDPPLAHRLIDASFHFEMWFLFTSAIASTTSFRVTSSSSAASDSSASLESTFSACAARCSLHFSNLARSCSNSFSAARVFSRAASANCCSASARASSFRTCFAIALRATKICSSSISFASTNAVFLSALSSRRYPTLSFSARSSPATSSRPFCSPLISLCRFSSSTLNSSLSRFRWFAHSSTAFSPLLPSVSSSACSFSTASAIGKTSLAIHWQASSRSCARSSDSSFFLAASISVSPRWISFASVCTSTSRLLAFTSCKRARCERD